MGPIDILLGVAFPLLFGTGVALVTSGSGTGEFLAGRACFALAALDLATLLVWWLYKTEHASWKMTLAAAIAVAGVLGLPQLLKWADDREAASIEERRAAVLRGSKELAPLIDVIRNLQGQLKVQNEAEQVTRRILAQYDQLLQGIVTFERFTGTRNERDRLAAAEHMMKELQAVTGNAVRLIDTPQGRGLVIRTAPNTFRVTFPVPMRIAPNIIFKQLPAGVTENVVEKSNIGFTVIFLPQTVHVETIPPFVASADF
ncbi:hypothetical protein [Bradyrhizobium sp. SZCCHNRI1003]|uniref:hypothetical protein n=1 Tax=Bradyrhizobium sp. SZCCHNRI1003 TaxID=3057275 RepID=UPI002915EE15|nr:hypothetical protein [Bradyrhizobium sp. SZCCHNRI1003]